MQCKNALIIIEENSHICKIKQTQNSLLEISQTLGCTKYSTYTVQTQLTHTESQTHLCWAHSTRDDIGQGISVVN